jgi:hypothetical protein
MENHLKAASLLAHLLDNQFRLFGFRFGLNGVLGLIPGAGDAVVAILSLYLVWIAIEMELPRIKIVEMIVNIVINFFIGLVPIIGDFADFFHKANLANLKILHDHAKRTSPDGKVLQPARYASA